MLRGQSKRVRKGHKCYENGVERRSGGLTKQRIGGRRFKRRAAANVERAARDPCRALLALQVSETEEHLLLPITSQRSALTTDYIQSAHVFSCLPQDRSLESLFWVEATRRPNPVKASTESETTYCRA